MCDYTREVNEHLPERRKGTTALENAGITDDSIAAAKLKQKFQELDTSRNGVLEIEELAKFLPGLAEEDLRKLYQHMDADGSEGVNFAEFVDFIFKPSKIVKDKRLLDRVHANPEDSMELVRLRFEGDDEAPALVRQVNFSGALLYDGVNGEMERGEGTYNGLPIFQWSRQRRMRQTEPLERIQERKRKKKAELAEATSESGMFTLAVAAPSLELFFCWSTDFMKIGWFVADTRPPEGEPVESWLMYNPSPFASTPNLCRAMWITTDGDTDKRLFCEPNTPANCFTPCAAFGKTDTLLSVPVGEENLEDDELWGELSSDDDADWQDGNWQTEWADQPGEAEAEDDGWDSDAFLEQNKHRAQIGIDARAVKQKALDDLEDERLLDEERKAEAERQAQEAAREAAERAAAEERERAERARRLAAARAAKRKEAFNPHFMEHAPGFVVKGHAKSPPADHLACRHRGRKSGGGRPSGAKALKTPKTPKAPVGFDDPDGDYSMYEDGLFIDPDFPPCQHSLGLDMPEVDGWARLSQLTEEPCLFYRIAPDDAMHQAFPGNMWFLSACAAAAEYPAWIQSIFGIRIKLSKACRYKVRLYHPGKQRFVRLVIDDYVPTRSRSPAFAGITANGEIWVALVEKAFAKLVGSYAQTEWGYNAHGMHYICGGACAESWSRMGPSRWRRSHTVWNGGDDDIIDRHGSEGKHEAGDWRDEDEVWGMIRLALERCYPITCGVDREQVGDVGLLADRKYSVICAREVRTEEEWILRMVKMRNPYGIGKWTGRWSDSSDAWNVNPDVRTALNYDPRKHKDGSFWISFSDFDKYFELIDFVRKSMPVQGGNVEKMNGVKKGLQKYVDTVTDSVQASMTAHRISETDLGAFRLPSSTKSLNS